MLNNKIRKRKIGLLPYSPPPPPPIPIGSKYNEDDIKLMFEECKLKIEALGSPLWHEEQQKRLREHFKLTD